MIETNHKGELTMKKTIIILVIILVLLAIAVGCAAVYFLSSPQFALLRILKDVKTEGLDGLEPHLTGDAAEVVETVRDITESPLASTILGLFGNNGYLDLLKTELQNVTWNVEDVMKGKKQAQVVLSFDYEGEITGTIHLSMVRTGDGWKIDGIKSPKIDNFSIGDITLPDFGNFSWKGTDAAT
jgi:hypothetical protein